MEEVEWEDEDYLPLKIVEQLKSRDSERLNPFKPGWKIEAVDLMDPKLICPSTVKVTSPFGLICVGSRLRQFDAFRFRGVVDGSVKTGSVKRSGRGFSIIN